MTDPSYVGALLPSWMSEPDTQELIRRLAAEGITAEDPREGSTSTDAPAHVEWADGALTVQAVDLDEHVMALLAPDLDDEARAGLKDAHYEVILAQMLDTDATLDSYVAQLQRLARLIPEAIALHDVSALQWRPMPWWNSTIEGRVPPPPDCLFTIHAVRSEDHETAWMHTHGLSRCGVIEIELLDLPVENASAMGWMMNVTAALLIERGVPEPGEAFEIGRGIEIAWIPWEDALALLPLGTDDQLLGRMNDREEHSGDRGALFVPNVRKAGLLRRRRVEWLPVASLMPILEDNPVFWISQMETQRMSALATERFPTFRKLVGRLVKDGEESDYSFLVKLGYQVDEEYADDDGERGSEHLWFTVHGIVDGQIEGTLLNQPHAIARMNEGDRGRHAVDQLSDWTIHSPHGSYGPDRVDLLLEQLAGE